MATVLNYLPKTSSNSQPELQGLLIFNANLIPTVANAFSVGNASFPVSFVQTGAIVSSGTLSLQATSITTSSPLSLGGNIIPTADNTQDLGSVGFRWATLYCSTIGSSAILTLSPSGNLVFNPGGTIIPSKNFVPSVDNSLTLGTSSTRFSTLFAVNVQAGGSSNLNLSSGSGGDITASQRIRPTVTTIHDLGTATFSWQSIFCQNYLSPGQMNISGSGVDPIVISPGTSNVIVNGTLRPLVNNTHNLGSTTIAWQQVWANSVSSGPAINLLLTAPVGQTVNVERNFLPLVDNGTNLGSNSNRFGTTNSVQVITDNIGSNGNVNINPTGIIIPSKNFVPSVDNSLTLGTSSTRFSTLFAVNIQAGGSSNLNLSSGSGGDITASQRIRPTVTTIHDLGTATFSWQSIFCQSYLSPGQMNISGSGVDPIVISPGTSNVIVNGTLRPLANNTHNLGSSSIAWQQVWANTISSGPAINLLLTAPVGQTVNVERNFLPLVDNSTNLGSSSNRFGTTNSVQVITDNIGSTGNVNINPTGIIVPVKNVVPSSSNSIDLGTTSTVWRTVFTPKVQASSELNVVTTSGRIKLTSADTTFLENTNNRLAFLGTTDSSSIVYSGVGSGSQIINDGATNTIICTFPNTSYNDIANLATLVVPTRGVYLVNFQIDWIATTVDINKWIRVTFRESGGTICQSQVTFGFAGSFGMTIMTPAFPGLLSFDIQILNNLGVSKLFIMNRCVVSMQYERT